MTKFKKLSTGILAMAIMSVCSLQGWAQSSKTTAPPKTSAKMQAEANSNALHGKPAESPQQTSMSVADPSNPELSRASRSLLKAKAELAKGQAENTLTPEQTATLNNRISQLELQVQKLSAAPESGSNNIAPSAPRTTARTLQNKTVNAQQEKEMAQKSVIRDIVEKKQCTRSQFLSLTEVQQRQMLLYQKDFTITDLVNATQADLKHRQDNLSYIPADAFKTYDILKQLHILNNPSNYIIVKDASDAVQGTPDSRIIVKDASLIPANNAVQGTPASRHKISKAELSTYPLDKQRAIKDSKDFIITD